MNFTTPDHLNQRLNTPQSGSTLTRFYGQSPQTLTFQKSRLRKLLERFESAFPGREEVAVFSAPGRTEVGGNHTDHNAGRVLAAAVDLDILAAVSPNADQVIRIHSEGYPPDLVSLDDLTLQEKEKNTSRALVRGVCARFKELGFGIGGFEAVATSTVPKGSGLSSSAAFEMLVATILNHLYNRGSLDPVRLAQVGQYAENHYFGKPCGLMDQTTSALGGLVTIDFADAQVPVVKKVDFDFTSSGYSLAITDTWGDHSDLTEDYEAVKEEMRAIAQFFGGNLLREISLAQVLQNIPALHTRVNDRAILRAIHFFRDNQRVVDQVQALESGNFPEFLRLVNESGRSSWMMLQNCYTTRNPTQQGIPVALAISEEVLASRGAWRVHGGGFAGTIQAFVPHELIWDYVRRMEQVCGEGSCHQVMIRADGAGPLAL
jgi:galactokinase